MRHKLPHPIWNLIALFFVAWFGIAGWLLLDGDTSPVVQLAFALCGSLGLFAGSTGGLYRGAGRILSRIRIRNQNIGCLSLTLFCLMIVGAVMAPIFIHGFHRVKVERVASALKSEGFQLLEYADKHGGVLPENMRGKNVYRYIRPVAKREQDHLGPFVWCGSLSGLRVKDVANPKRVVVAYTREPDGVYCPVLYLDGHIKSVYTQDQLNKILRERPALLAVAKRRKAERVSGARNPL
jgi:hypothetical protein